MGLDTLTGHRGPDPGRIGHEADFLFPPSIPAGRHPSRRVALSQVHSELPQPFIAIWRRTISPPYTNLRERSISLSVRQRLFLGGGRLHVRSATAAGLLVCRDDLQIGTDRGRERLDSDLCC